MHSTSSWDAIPIQDYKEEWWDLSIDEIDKKLFNKYDVPQYIQDFLFNNIQRKTILNIVNFDLDLED